MTNMAMAALAYALGITFWLLLGAAFVLLLIAAFEYVAEQAGGGEELDEDTE